VIGESEEVHAAPMQQGIHVVGVAVTLAAELSGKGGCSWSGEV
jgi:hypothetical protein